MWRTARKLLNPFRRKIDVNISRTPEQDDYLDKVLKDYIEQITH